MSDLERIAKVIAHSGRASRREAERMVEEGRVQVNGTVVEHPGTLVNPNQDHVKVDGHPLPAPPEVVVCLLHKPRGYITGRNDPEGRKSVLDLVNNLNVRVEPVGRLDIDTEGALLLTNDGMLAHKLTHPSSEVPRRYLAKIYRVPSDKTLNRIRSGVHLEDGRTTPCKARVVETTDGGNAWIEITVTEGRNRLIRRLLAAVGHPVSKLRRMSFGTVALRKLERGQHRILTKSEVERLRQISEGIDPDEAGKTSRYKQGHARPRPKKNKPLSRKKNAQRRARAKARGEKDSTTSKRGRK
ncbi:MAG: pseudouridine synthase [Myxococcota bacterium]|nr:pseudouridine synthase [Myxococcota bacterium]